MREDLTAAIRSFRTAPGFTAVVLAVLTLAIGAGTAIFSVVDAVVLRGLPFDEHDRLVTVREVDIKRPTTFANGSTTPPMYADWRRLQESFTGLGAYNVTSFWSRDERNEPSLLYGLRVTYELLPVLRVAPLLGRTFTAADEIDGQHRVAILGYGYWQRRYGGSADVLGKTLTLGDESWEVVGVMPRGFSFPIGNEQPTDLYVPMAFKAKETTRDEGSYYYGYNAIGRLKDGISLDQANDQMGRVMAAVQAQFPKWSPDRRLTVVALHEFFVGRVRGWMLMLLGAVGLVLLIACANVANLLLARATVREREIAIRAALGASRWRLVRALLIEGLVLSLAGTVLGIALAYWGVDVLRAWMPARVPRVAAIAIDLRVLAVTIAAACATGLFFGLVPAIHSSRPSLTLTLKEGGRSVVGGGVGQRLRSGLVIVEVALAVILLVGAGLFIGSFIKLLHVDPGFEYRNVLALNISVRVEPGKEQEMAPRGVAYLQQMIDAVERVPGVSQAAAVEGGLPLTGRWSRNRVALPGRGELNGDDDSIDRRIVTLDYLTVLRVPLLRGRMLSADDRAGAQPVVVINEAAARKYWPGQEALGQRISINKQERVVVGVVGNVRHLGPENPVRQECYIPIAQLPITGGTLVMRTTMDPLQVLPAVKSAILAVNPEQRLTTDLASLESHMDRLIEQRRFNMALLTLFGVVGLVIAAIGLYGVMAYIVAQRTNEIGVRMALGATPRHVVGMVVRRSAMLMIAGLVIGLAGAWYLGAGVKTFLFEIEPTDARVLLLALATLLLSGLLATLLPARRAARVDPLIALRSE